MGDWVIIALVAATAISYAVGRSAFNPVTITLAIFTLVSSLANLDLYGLYGFSDIAYKIVLVGCLSILGGALLAALVHGVSLKNEKRARIQMEREWRVSYRFLSAGLLLAVIVMVLTRSDSLLTLASGGNFADVRRAYLGYGGDQVNEESLGALLGRVIVSPILFVSVPVFIYGLLEGVRARAFNRLFLVAMFLNLVTTGGRIIFVYAVVQLLVLLAVKGRLRVRMSRGRATLLVVVLLSLVTAVTLSRGNTILFEAYTYFAIPLPLLAHWASMLDAQAISTDGSTTLYGVVTLVASGARLFGLDLAQTATMVVNRPQDQWVELLPGRPFNAFVTMFYYFYADFRMPGVVVFSAAYGYALQAIFSRARSFGGALPKLLLLLTIQSVVMSFVRWQATDGAYVISFALLFIAVRRTSNRDMVVGDDAPSELPRSRDRVGARV